MIKLNHTSRCRIFVQNKKNKHLCGDEAIYMKYVVESGKFTLKAGSSFDDIRLTGNVSVK